MNSKTERERTVTEEVGRQSTYVLYILNLTFTYSLRGREKKDISFVGLGVKSQLIILKQETFSFSTGIPSIMTPPEQSVDKHL